MGRPGEGNFAGFVIRQGIEEYLMPLLERWGEGKGMGN